MRMGFLLRLVNTALLKELHQSKEFETEEQGYRNKKN